MLLRSLVPGKLEQSVTNKRVVNQVLVQHRLYCCEFIRLTSDLCDPKLQSLSKLEPVGQESASEPRFNPQFYSILAERSINFCLLRTKQQQRGRRHRVAAFIETRNLERSLFDVDLTGVMKWSSPESEPSLWARTLLKLHFKPTPTSRNAGFSITLVGTAGAADLHRSTTGTRARRAPRARPSADSDHRRQRGAHARSSILSCTTTSAEHTLNRLSLVHTRPWLWQEPVLTRLQASCVYLCGSEKVSERERDTERQGERVSPMSSGTEQRGLASWQSGFVVRW